MKDGIYLNRELSDVNNEQTMNYIPIEPIDNHRMFGTCFDAVEICELLAQINPNIMDLRVIHRPASAQEPYPLTDQQVRENVNLLLSSCKAIALRLPAYTASTWLNAQTHASLLIAVIHTLAKEKLKTFVNFEKHPEIVRLLTQHELNDDPEKIKHILLPEEILKRWLNFVLSRTSNLNIGNITVDIYNVLRKIDGNFMENSSELKNNVMNKLSAEQLLSYVKDVMHVETNITSDDILYGNIKLEELLAAQIFDVSNGLSSLTDVEKEKYCALWIDDNHDDDAYLPFLNSQLPPHMRITNIYRDLSDGIILSRILERMKPGCS